MPFVPFDDGVFAPNKRRHVFAIGGEDVVAVDRKPIRNPVMRVEFERGDDRVADVVGVDPRPDD